MLPSLVLSQSVEFSDVSFLCHASLFLIRVTWRTLSVWILHVCLKVSDPEHEAVFDGETGSKH